MAGKVQKAPGKLVSVRHVTHGHPVHREKWVVERKLVLSTSTAARLGVLHGGIYRVEIKRPNGDYITPLVVVQVSDLQAHPAEHLTAGPSFDFALATEHAAYRPN